MSSSFTPAHEITKRPKVAFNGRFLTRRQSGVQRVAGQLVKAVDDELALRGSPGSDFELVCPNRANADVLDLRALPVRQSGASIGTQAWEQLQLPLIARNDILVSLCNIAPLLSAGGITMMHDAQTYLTPESYSTAFVSWYHFAAPRIAKRAARIVTVSEFSKQMLVQYGVVEAEKIQIVHNGVDHLLSVTPDRSIVARHGLQPRGYVLAMTSPQAHKNVQVLLKAFADASLANTPLVLYGDFEHLPAGVAAPPNVVFTGRISDAELRSLMENAAVFAFPSTTEGFGLPPMEAMSLGCPAVVAPCGALPEVCGDAALYADPQDPAAWAAAIRHLLDDPESHATWSARAAARAAMFPWAKSARELLTVIDEVTAGEPYGGDPEKAKHEQMRP